MTTITYTISARGKPADVPILQFLQDKFSSVSQDAIDSVFGFVERTTLYGGRIFERRELGEDDIANLYNANINYRIPLTNHYVDQLEYEMSAPFLDRYHRAGNSVILTNDDLARWIRRDFPLYQIEASVIKNINSHHKIADALPLYDTVILPMRMNEDHEFLDEIEEKHRVTLFANAGCALTCPSKTCYASISKANKNNCAPVIRCSQSLKAREMLGMFDFDLDTLVQLGFHRFKLLRGRPGHITGY